MTDWGQQNEGWPGRAGPKGGGKGWNQIGAGATWGAMVVPDGGCQGWGQMSHRGWAKSRSQVGGRGGIPSLPPIWYPILFLVPHPR